MKKTFPPQFEPADFAGFPKPTQKVHEGRDERLQPQPELEPLVFGTDHGVPPGELDMSTLEYK